MEAMWASSGASSNAAFTSSNVPTGGICVRGARGVSGAGGEGGAKAEFWGGAERPVGLRGQSEEKGCKRA